MKGLSKFIDNDSEEDDDDNDGNEGTGFAFAAVSNDKGDKPKSEVEAGLRLEELEQGQQAAIVLVNH